MSLEPENWIEVDSGGIGWEMTHVYSSGQTVYDHNHTTRRQLPVVLTNFCCPVCGNGTFEAIHYNPETARLHQPLHDMVIGPRSSGDGYSVITITDYRCPGCTIHFDDPAKFSKSKPAEIIAPIATDRDRFGLLAAKAAMVEEALG